MKSQLTVVLLSALFFGQNAIAHSEADTATYSVKSLNIVLQNNQKIYNGMIFSNDWYSMGDSAADFSFPSDYLSKVGKDYFSIYLQDPDNTEAVYMLSGPNSDYLKMAYSENGVDLSLTCNMDGQPVQGTGKVLCKISQ